MPDALLGHKTVLVFGGSFDPPHRAHVALPQQAARAIGADLVAYVPAGRAPHKLDRVQTDPRHRVAMLRLALAAAPSDIDSVILTDEVDRGPSEPSYTVDTLEHLSRRIDDGATLRLLIGADQLRIFDSWREPERIVQLAEPVVMVRPPDTRDTLLDALPEDLRDAWSSRLVSVDQRDISSTAIRERIAEGLPIDEWVAESVAEYIDEHGLYR
jgi:nicotinate-nucleotide adenylyltransferase